MPLAAVVLVAWLAGEPTAGLVGWGIFAFGWMVLMRGVWFTGPVPRATYSVALHPHYLLLGVDSAASCFAWSTVSPPVAAEHALLVTTEVDGERRSFALPRETLAEHPWLEPELRSHVAEPPETAHLREVIDLAAHELVHDYELDAIDARCRKLQVAERAKLSGWRISTALVVVSLAAAAAWILGVAAPMADVRSAAIGFACYVTCWLGVLAAVNLRDEVWRTPQEVRCTLAANADGVVDIEPRYAATTAWRSLPEPRLERDYLVIPDQRPIYLPRRSFADDDAATDFLAQLLVWHEEAHEE